MKNKILSSLLSVALIFVILAALFVIVPQMVKAKKAELSKPATVRLTIPDRLAFNYQSSLAVKGQPANGLYDFEFRLYDDLGSGNQLGQTQTSGQVEVDKGLFTVFLNFGDVLTGQPLYLEVGLRPNGSDDPFTTLTPRQAIIPVVQEADIGAAAVSGEFWKLGFTREGEPAYNSIIGRLAGVTAAFRCQQDVADIYYIFPAPAGQKTVLAAKFYILDRTGSYNAGDATLTLEIFDYAGTLQHTVSAAAVDMETATTGAWTTITLSDTAANLNIAPGEFLAFHFSLDSGSAGSLDVRPVFEVEVQ